MRRFWPALLKSMVASAFPAPCTRSNSANKLGSSSTVSVAAVVRHDVTYRQEFGQLIDDIQRGLGVGTRA